MIYQEAKLYSTLSSAGTGTESSRKRKDTVETRGAASVGLGDEFRGVWGTALSRGGA